MSSTPKPPLDNIEEWDEFVRRRYQPDRQQADFRDFSQATEGVRELYRQNHRYQTLETVNQKHEDLKPGSGESLSMWETLDRLNTLVDDSDPDTDLPQVAHALQTAERIRAAGHPDWMQLTGLIHDSGKMLCLRGEPQWAVVGDTFPVGCAFSDTIVFPEFFADNPDTANPELQTETGIYEEGCGLDNVYLSWGHDEYAYQVLKDSNLPLESLYMLRYHSFYPWHREGAYHHLMDDQDRRMLPWVNKFNPFDLYSKSDAAPDTVTLKPYYQSLIDRYLPAVINW
jgi:inositol oxygenase